MKIIITGSLGHISKPLTEELVQKGHEVTVISSNAEKQKDIEALVATAGIGSLEDVDFLSATFTGADAVYTMIPPPPSSYFDHSLDLNAYVFRIANNYIAAIQQSGVKRVVHLSSIGAHLNKGTGIILVYHDVEAMLGKLADAAITFMRPTAFYYNLFSFIPAIKNTGGIAANYGDNDNVAWVSPIDIAAAIAEDITTPLTGSKVRYVASEELTCTEVAHILGEAIGKPDLKWTTIATEQMKSFLVTVGMNPEIAAGLAEMQASMQTGVFFEDYYLNRPEEMGKIKLVEFAKDFAAAFNK